MSLENLLKINQLQRHAATADEVQRLLAAASRNLADSGVAGLSDETRFDAAYKAHHAVRHGGVDGQWLQAINHHTGPPPNHDSNFGFEHGCWQRSLDCSRLAAQEAQSQRLFG